MPRRYYISMTERDVEGFASIGALWIQEGSDSPRAASKEGTGLKAKIDDLEEISEEEFNNLIAIENKMERFSTLSSWDKTTEQATLEMMDTDSSDVDEAKEVDNRSRSISVATFHSDGYYSGPLQHRTPQQCELPDWMIKYQENWRKHQIEPESMVTIRSHRKERVPFAFGILKAILENPDNSVFAVIRLLKENEMPPSSRESIHIEKYLSEIFKDSDNLKVFPLDSTECLQFYLTTRIIKANKSIPVGSIIIPIEKNVCYDCENHTTYRVDNHISKLPVIPIHSCQILMLFRVNDHQSRVEVAMSKRLEMMQIDESVIIRIGKREPMTGTIEKVVDGFVEVLVQGDAEKIVKTTVDNIFNIDWIPEWVEDAKKKVLPKGCAAEYNGQRYNLQAVIKLPWEFEEQVILETEEGQEKIGTIPNSVSAYTYELNIQNLKRCALIYRSQVNIINTRPNTTDNKTHKERTGKKHNDIDEVSSNGSSKRKAQKNSSSPSNDQQQPKTAVTKAEDTISEFEVGDFVEFSREPNARGFIRCIFDASTGTFAGIDLIARYSKPSITSQRFLSAEGFGIFKNLKDIRKTTIDPVFKDVDKAPAISAQKLRYLIGDDRGIQGECNSCYLDSLIFSLFAFDDTLDKYSTSSDDAWQDMARKIFWQGIVFPLRERHFVRREKIGKLRSILKEKSGDEAFLNKTRDLPETINLLFGAILGFEEFLKIESQGHTSRAFNLETIKLEGKFTDISVFTSQLFYEFSCMQMECYFSELPNILILQMPREKGFSNIMVPSLQLNLKQAHHNRSGKKCVKCGFKATHYCESLFDEHGLLSTLLCKECAHFYRNSKEMTDGDHGDEDWELGLSAVICIERSHYNCFVRCGSDDNWVFFDSMAGQKKEDEKMVNIPKIKRVDVTRWIRRALSISGAELKKDLKDRDFMKERLFRYSYALIYRPFT